LLFSNSPPPLGWAFFRLLPVHPAQQVLLANQSHLLFHAFFKVARSS